MRNTRWNAHAEALRSGDRAAIGTAYINALEAERTLLRHYGGPADARAADEIDALIANERAALAARC